MQIINDYKKKDFHYTTFQNNFYAYDQDGDIFGKGCEEFNLKVLNALNRYGFIENFEDIKNSKIRFENFVYSDLSKLYDTRQGYFLANRIRIILANSGLSNVVDKEYLDSIGFKDSKAYEDMFSELYYTYEDILGDADIFGIQELLLTSKSMLKNYVGLSDEDIQVIEEGLKSVGLSFMPEKDINQIRNIVIYEDSIKGIIDQSASVQLSYDVLQTKKRLIEKQLSEIDKELTNYRGK